MGGAFATGRGLRFTSHRPKCFKNLLLAWLTPSGAKNLFLSKIDPLYVKLYGTLSEKDFVAATLASLNQIESKLEKLVKLVQSATISVKLGMSIDPITGSDLKQSRNL